MTKDITLLLSELQSEVPTKFHSVANKSTLRHELEKYEAQIILGIASGHTARGFYEKLKDATEIKAISNEFNPSRPEDTFKQHFIRVFQDYRLALVAEGKVEKSASYSRKSKTSAARKAPAKPVLAASEVVPPIHKPELPQAPLKSAEPAIIEDVPVLAVEPVTSTPSPKPAQEGNSLRRNKLSEF